MALASYHIHLNPGSQLTKQAPSGGEEGQTVTCRPHAKSTTKMAAQPEARSPATQRKTAADSQSPGLHQCF